jgi:hypothetical protein
VASCTQSKNHTPRPIARIQFDCKLEDKSVTMECHFHFARTSYNTPKE